MPYSAVIQPRAWPFSHGGSRSSSVAVTSTWVSPNFTKQEPSANFTTPRSSETGRNSSGCRRLGRIIETPWWGAGPDCVTLLGVSPWLPQDQAKHKAACRLRAERLPPRAPFRYGSAAAEGERYGQRQGRGSDANAGKICRDFALRGYPAACARPLQELTARRACLRGRRLSWRRDRT